MELEFLKKEKNHVEVILHGEDHSFPSALREKLVAEKGVEFVAVTRDHPTAADPKLVLKTKGKDAREVIASAVRALQKDVKGFTSHMKRHA
jgi:DNA-directed RNA polymerase subunit L